MNAQTLRGPRRYAARCAHFAVVHWPLSVERHGTGRIYWALIPWAGLWAYSPDGGGA
jgi:hypothetical protein